MYSLISTPVKTKLPKVLHIVYPADIKMPLVVDEIKAIRADIPTIYRLGEHVLTDHRFNEFNVVAIHSCSTKHQKDYLNRLLDSKQRLLSVAGSSTKKLLIYGNSIQLIGNKVFIVPHQGNVFINQLTSMGGIDLETSGLGITNAAIDYDFSPDRITKQYTDCLKYLSRQRKIWLLDPQAVLDSDGKVQFGSMYVAYQGRITLVKQCDEIVDKKEKAKAANRTIKPISPVYKKEDVSDEAKRIEDDKTAKNTNQTVNVNGK